jgi:N-methylhydantoinase A
MDQTVLIGIDVGGTFTDFVLHDRARKLTLTDKRLTTPAAPSRAIIQGLEQLLRESATPIARVGRIVHGTTLATNALLERNGARVGLITTEGFADVLEMGREIRFDIEDLRSRPAPPLVPRRRRIGVAGRLAADGTEYAPLDEAGVLGAARHLADDHRIHALAVSFLHAYANPAHELQARAIVLEAYPQMLVSVSAEVAGELGEYERTTTTCVNAYVQPIMNAYLDQLHDELKTLGFEGRLQIMLSNGGLTSVEHAKAFPVKLLESGPAAGAIAAGFLARRADEARVISFDMGGTTAKMCVIDDGRHKSKHTFEAARVDKFKPGSGLPLRLSVVDMIEIGSGGGSVAAASELGLLTVGPRSAGAVPGPVAYGQGGEEPTVTDSDVLMGYLDPDSLLGVGMPLEVEDVVEAVARRLAEPLNLGIKAAAVGIQDVVTESMAAATRMHLAEKGRDPSGYTLMAFGGAGPVHAYSLAKRLKIRRVLVPIGAGVISALGFLLAAPAVDAVRGYPAPLDAVDWPRVQALLGEMEAEARYLLAAGGDEATPIRFKRSADMRYVGQGHEIEVPLPDGELGAENEEAIRDAFAEAYGSMFGRTVDDAMPEIISWRSSAMGHQTEIDLDHQSLPATALLGSRRVHFLDHGEIESPVYNRYALAPGSVISGPAVFQERTTACSFGPDCRITVDGAGNLVAEIAPSS